MTRCILIVDDDPDIRAVARVALEKFAGWKTLIAASGLEALDLAKQALPDAILLDVSMPDHDGFWVFEQLQAVPLTQGIPVILLTAKALSRDRRHFSTMGVIGVITKPFDPITVWLQVAELLGWVV